jgi:4-amino-4-deoxy-L-arabinose transferase-like glycosyltransferase
LRLGWLVFAARPPQGLHDPSLYTIAAIEIAIGNGYSGPDGAPTAYFPVGYPALLGAVFHLVGRFGSSRLPTAEEMAAAARGAPTDQFEPLLWDLVTAGAALNLLLGVATVALVYRVGRDLFGQSVGRIAAFWVAVFPSLVFHTALLLSETLFCFLVMAVLALCSLAPTGEREIGRVRLLSSGALLGLSALVRPLSLLILPFALLAWLQAGAGLRRTLRFGAWTCLGTLVVMTPWSLRNALVMPEPVLISTNTGDNLCIGHHPGAQGGYSHTSYCLDDELYAGIPRVEVEVRRNRDNVRKALDFAVENPRAELILLGRKAFHLLKHDHDALTVAESWGTDAFIGPALRRALERVADLFFFATLGLGVCGMLWIVWRPRDPRRLPLLYATLALLLAPLAFFGDPRFHVPVLPLLAITAAWVTRSLLERMRRLPAD